MTYDLNEIKAVARAATKGRWWYRFQKKLKPGIQIDLRDPCSLVFGAPSGMVEEHHQHDSYAATRRAIVRAAAAI